MRLLTVGRHIVVKELQELCVAAVRHYGETSFSNLPTSNATSQDVVRGQRPAHETKRIQTLPRTLQLLRIESMLACLFSKRDCIKRWLVR
jgi:hypothetical protein